MASPVREREVSLSVFVNSDPAHTFTITNPDGSPFDWTDHSAEFYRKARIDGPDGLALYTSGRSEITFPDIVGGVAQVQFAAADLRWPTQQRWHLDAIDNFTGRRTIVAYGALTVAAR